MTRTPMSVRRERGPGHRLGGQVQTESPSRRREEWSRAQAAGGLLPWWQGWTPLFLLPAAVTLTVPPTWPCWAFMWAFALAIYAGCKWLTWRRAPVQGVPFWRHSAYLLAWPGLDAAAFLNPRASSLAPPPSLGEWWFAASKLVLGAGLLFGVVRWVPSEFPYLLGWVG